MTLPLYQNGFIRKSILSKLEMNSAVLLNVMQLTNLSLNAEMVSPMPITLLNVIETINCETLEFLIR
jgi:hypothetical protein